MSDVQIFLACALEKVFLSRAPERMACGTRISTWRGAHAAAQLVFYLSEDEKRRSCGPTYTVEAQGMPQGVTLAYYEVKSVPTELACYSFATADANYLSYEPGLYPDVLKAAAENKIRTQAGQYRAMWLRFDVSRDAVPGDHPITLRATTEGDAQSCSLVLHIGAAEIPKQTLIHTEWFHADCLADYYHVDVWSEEHWRIVENFIAAAAHHGINMILTPVVTPALDTEVGGERTTVQLVDVTLADGKYAFGFDKLRRWVEICRRHGVEYLEIAHPYTQWGAKAAPKIMATVNGEYKRIFGWDTPATGDAYRKFLYAFIPALKEALWGMGMDREHVYFHVSDEPNADNLESYCAAKEQIDPLLEDCLVMDALSNIEFYEKGIVQHPVPCSDHIQPFFDAKIPNLWTYYCCSQSVDVPNRFFSMPSARNRIMGVLMYLYDIKGFLQWGFNFYNSQYSVRHISPYEVTDAGGAFPGGDAFLVYPGEDGEAVSSVRAEVQDDLLLDLRALRALEEKIGREAVEEIIYRNAPMKKMTFKDYPHDAQYLLDLREELAKALDA